MELTYWKSQENLSVRKCGNPEKVRDGTADSLIRQNVNVGRKM